MSLSGSEDKHAESLPDGSPLAAGSNTEALKSVEGGYWEWPDTEVPEVIVSPAISKLLGFGGSRRKLSLEESFRNLYPIDLNYVTTRFEHAMSTGGMFAYRYRVRVNQETRWLQTVGEIEMGPNGPTSAQGYTFRIDSDPTLLSQQTQYLAAAETVLRKNNVHIWYWPSVSGAIVHFNDQNLMHPGEPDEDHPWKGYLHPDDLGDFRRAVAGAIERGDRFDVEHRFRLGARSKYRYYACSGVVVKRLDGSYSMSGTLVDVHNRMEETVEHQRTLQRLDLVIRATGAGIYDLEDTTDDQVILDRTFYDLLGYDRSELESSVEAVLALIHPDDVAHVREALTHSYRTKIDLDVEYRTIMKGRGWRYVHSMGVIEADVHGEGCHRLVGAIVDIHDQVVAEQRLKAANKELEQFSYILAHDLRAPLRHITALTEILREDYGEGLQTGALEILKTIEQAGNNATQMIKELHGYAKIGNQRLNVQTVDLGEVVAEVKNTLTASEGAADIDWAIGPLPTLNGDPTQLYMLFQNLLANAIKFTRRVPEPKISVNARQRKTGDWEIVVTDNGAGFPSDKAEEIFGAFNRAHTEGDYEGTGIGLAHVAKIVARHGGRIHAESEDSEGATFRILLPAS